ncbi:MAG TPA: hypothetical protein VGC18_04300, partial [Lacisediminihabitans sp.]|uniref:hypothetical protein n=1 Tax=Lacisediminihabitans sp. TaxID=2787631 RepID=UPI002EDAA24F
MTHSPRFLVALRAALRPPSAPRRTSRRLAAGAAAGSLALLATFALAPPMPTGRITLVDSSTGRAQTLTASEKVAAAETNRDGYSATPGMVTLAASGTNYDWAKLVLQSAGWPLSDSNVTVLVRWMRQENGTSSWWNRNNPLNNGWGSGGGGGTGTYPNLVVAAQMAAENLHRNSVFRAIAAAFAASAPTEVIEQAIWASPWASSHYANGAHWHYT